MAEKQPASPVARKSLDTVARFTVSSCAASRDNVDQRVIRGLLADGWIVARGELVWATEKGLRAYGVTNPAVLDRCAAYVAGRLAA